MICEIIILRFEKGFVLVTQVSNVFRWQKLTTFDIQSIPHAPATTHPRSLRSLQLLIPNLILLSPQCIFPCSGSSTNCLGFPPHNLRSQGTFHTAYVTRTSFHLRRILPACRVRLLQSFLPHLHTRRTHP